MTNIIDKKLIDFPFLEEPVALYKLENGHTIIIANKKGELINISTWVKTGSINENDEITGISHFLEHLMFKGTTRYEVGEFDRILESKGGIVNAATWKDYTFYYVTLPKGEGNENYQLVLDLHADMMLNAVIPEEEVGPAFDFKNPNVDEKRERYVVIEEIRMRDDQPWTKTYNEANYLMYKEHPYKRDVIGTAEVISSIPRQTIVDYYKNWYTPDNMTTILVGDFEPDNAINDIIEKFNFENVKETIRPQYNQESIQNEQRKIEKTGNINTGFVIIGYHGPKARNLKESIALDVISIILGEGKSSRLYQNLVQKPAEPIFNVIGSGQYQFKDGNTFFIQGNFKPESKDKAVDLIMKEVETVINNGIEDEELTKAKKNLKSRFAEESETVSEIGEAIGYYMTVCEDIYCYSDYLKELDKLTKQDIIDICLKYLTVNKANISVLVPEKQLD